MVGCDDDSFKHFVPSLLFSSALKEGGKEESSAVPFQEEEVGTVAKRAAAGEDTAATAENILHEPKFALLMKHLQLKKV